MTPERWRRITALFHGALAHDAAERDAFLHDACRNEPDLRAEVEAMIAAHTAAGRFGDTTALPLESAVEPGFRLEPGATLGRYRIERLIGAGGMGEVYRARDPQLERDVAVKVLSAHVGADAGSRQRLLQEARSAAALNHPHVCTIHEVAEAGGLAYIVMELIDGERLENAIGAGGLSVEPLLNYARQIVDAVAHAHACGIIHRDLKTSNTLITPEGRVKVLDFGLATRRSAEPAAQAFTSTPAANRSTLAGTLAYMAPERLQGGRGDARTDVWSLGVMMYEMAAGIHPFAGRTAHELASAILHAPPAPLAAHVPRELSIVIERCLRKDPAQRYGDAREVRAALEAIRIAAAPVAVTRRPRAERRRLAVLPLENLSGDPEQEYFADGTHDALITELAGVSALRVIARSSVMRYKGHQPPLSELASQLNADMVLTGTIVRAANRVRITAQLVDVSTEEHLWAGRYDRSVSDVLSLQNDIVASIARAIALQLTPQEEARLARSRPVHPVAYEAYLRGRFNLYKMSRQHSNAAMECFQRAVENDPDWALGYVGLASGWMIRADSGIVPASEARATLEAAVAKAIELDDTLAEVHEVAANYRFLYEWDWSGAEREFRRAIELNPNYAEAHFFYADFFAAMKRPAEARAEMARAIELDPLSPFVQCFVGWHLVYWRRYDEAIAQLTRTLSAEPSLSSAHMGLWGAFCGKEMWNDALEEARRFFAALGDTEIQAALTGGGATGYMEAMRRAAATLAARAKHTYVPAIRIARLYAHASDRDRAIEWLERAWQRRETPLIHLSVAWDWDGLRNDRRFEQLLDRMALPH